MASVAIAIRQYIEADVGSETRGETRAVEVVI